MVLIADLIFFVVSRRTQASRGGDESGARPREKGSPPFESVDREG